MEKRVPLSVVIATAHPWPELEMTLDSLWPQVRALGAELILLDCDGRGLPDDFGARFPGAVAVVRPGASVFALRAIGLERARGEIVAITEDHCRLPPDWLRQLVETHHLHPEAAAVGGAVENGSTETLIDWANYFVAHSPLMPPIRSGEADMISLQAGMALKRRALPGDTPPLGLMEMLYVAELRRRGETLIANGDIVVDHVQSHGFWNTFAVHYHNGRSIAGFRRQGSSKTRRLGYLATRPALPALLILRAVAAVVRKRRRAGKLFLSLPLVVALAFCHTAGEVMGTCFGAGKSPEKLS